MRDRAFAARTGAPASRIVEPVTASRRGKRSGLALLHVVRVHEQQSAAVSAPFYRFPASADFGDVAHRLGQANTAGRPLFWRHAVGIGPPGAL